MLLYIMKLVDQQFLYIIQIDLLTHLLFYNSLKMLVFYIIFRIEFIFFKKGNEYWYDLQA